MGAIKVRGRVEDTPPPPAIVMPLSIEPSKPRLVHDQQYLNSFMQQCPFSLDQVVNLPRYLSQNSFQTKLDDKSGFDHFFSFRRIANRLWARNGEDGGLCGGLFDRDG